MRGSGGSGGTAGTISGHASMGTLMAAGGSAHVGAGLGDNSSDGAPGPIGGDGPGTSASDALPPRMGPEARAAALAKYRRKRKERCFQKKVRYTSRQRLVVQRPRYRGQFVRHLPPGAVWDHEAKAMKEAQQKQEAEAAQALAAAATARQQEMSAEGYA